jgi:hypothetical protein
VIFVNHRTDDRKEKVKYVFHMIVAGVLVFLFLGIFFVIVAIVLINKTNMDWGTIYFLIFLSGLMCVLYFGLKRFLKSQNLKIE